MKFDPSIRNQVPPEMVRHLEQFEAYFLCRSLIRSVNDADFLTYGLVGRSVIEHAAVLRYFPVLP